MTVSGGAEVPAPGTAVPDAGSRRPSLVGERLRLDVTRVAHGGHCVARRDGQVVFVRHSLPGETVEALVTKGREGDRYLFADAVRILAPSDDRVQAPCPASGPGGCGGCDFQHVALTAQRALKAEVVREQLARLGGVEADVTVHPVPGDTDGLRWRTRVGFGVDRAGRPGLRRHASHEVVPLADCLIARPEATAPLRRRWPRTRTVEVVVPGVGEPVIMPTPPGAGRAPQVRERVEVGAWSREFTVPPRGFWQVHPGAAATFVASVLRGLAPRPGERCLDLYAGVGLFAAALADAVGPQGSVLAVEADRAAAARAALDLRDLPNLAVRQGRVERVLAETAGEPVDLVVLDPPRSGAGAAVVASMLARGPRAVAYVACDPAALARDLAAARAAGYTPAGIEAYDAFPMTHHVECIAILRPKRGDAGGAGGAGSTSSGRPRRDGGSPA